MSEFERRAITKPQRDFLERKLFAFIKVEYDQLLPKY